MRDPEPLLAWPAGESLRLSLPLSLLFTLFFYSVYGAASHFAALRGTRPAFHFGWELDLPFVPGLAPIYLSLPLVLLAAPFALRTARRFVPLFLALSAETVLGGICFFLDPRADVYGPRKLYGEPGGIAALFRLADRLNLDANEVPSLHVAFTVTAALFLGRRCGPLGRTLFALWALAVSASTMLLHEHHLLDVASGAALGFLATWCFARWAAKDERWEGARIEAICAGELFAFARRHPRYLLVALALYHAGIPHWRRSRLLRAGYCLTQHLDDVLDGDRQVEGSPEAYAQSVARQLREDVPGGSEGLNEPRGAFALARFVAREAASRPTGEEEIHRLEELIEVLIADRRRMDAREAMPAEALAEHHRRTFELSFDLTFRFAGTGLRARQVPELVAALAWVSPVRDLAEDFERGIVNLPAEVLAEAGWRGEETEIGPLLATPAVRAWLRAEHQRGTAAIAALDAKLPALADSKGRTIVALFQRALAAYERKYRRRETQLLAETEPQRARALEAGAP